MTDRNADEGDKSGRVYVPFDKDLTDEEIVAALREAAGLDPNLEPSADAEESTETSPDAVSDK